MKRVRDPIHNYVELDEMGRELVDTPRLQRLRRIHQLGTGSIVYPGANHTRFEHSLGAYHLAGQACEVLGIEAAERRTVQAAALLHDVGHGPFSHTCDGIYRDYLNRTHEALTCEALEKGALPDILRRHGVEPNDVADAVNGQGRWGPLVSGDLDVDRLDYLVRDAHYTGVVIGVDLARLVGGMVLTPEGLAIRQGSLAAAESVLVTRVQMYASVYFHKTLRVAERMLERAFRLALDAGEIKPDELPKMDDIAATMRLRHSKTPAWRLMLAVDQRKLYKVCVSEPSDDFREDEIERIADDPAAQAALEQTIASRLGLDPLDVIVDVPRLPRLRETRTRIIQADGTSADMASVSSLTRALGGAQRDHWRLRVMVPASVREQAAAVAGRLLDDELGA